MLPGVTIVMEPPVAAAPAPLAATAPVVMFPEALLRLMMPPVPLVPALAVIAAAVIPVEAFALMVPPEAFKPLEVMLPVPRVITPLPALSMIVPPAPLPAVLLALMVALVVRTSLPALRLMFLPLVLSASVLISAFSREPALKSKDPATTPDVSLITTPPRSGAAVPILMNPVVPPLPPAVLMAPVEIEAAPTESSSPAIIDTFPADPPPAPRESKPTAVKVLMRPEADLQETYQ